MRFCSASFFRLSCQEPKKGDFLIISPTSKLSIFNQFEQILTETDLKYSLYTPFLIVNRKETLGDQITEDSLQYKDRPVSCFSMRKAI